MATLLPEAVEALGVQPLTVTLDLGEGALGGAELAVGSLVPEPEDPVRPGYTFVGWYTLAAGGVLWDFETDIVTVDTTLYARWEVDAGATELAATGAEEAVAGWLASAMIALGGIAVVRARRSIR